MGILGDLFNKNDKQNQVEYYRANLYQKNIAIQIENDTLEFVISFHHSLINIGDDLISIKTVNGQQYNLPIKLSEKDFLTTVHVGKLQNGNNFRLIQPIGLSLDLTKSDHNAVGAFTIGSVNPNGWALHFFLTNKDDIRQTKVFEKGSANQIQKLIEGSLMGIRFGLPNKFIECSKQLLTMIENNPSQLKYYDQSKEFIQIMKKNLVAYNNHEKNIINKI